MKVALVSMPDVIPTVIHEMALHMPNHGIACIGGNLDEGHEVYLIDLVRQRRRNSLTYKAVPRTLCQRLQSLSIHPSSCS